MQSEISERFQALAADPDGASSLAEGALIVAAEVRPEVDIATGIEQVEETAERARPLVEAATSPSAATTLATATSTKSLRDDGESRSPSPSCTSTSHEG